MAKNKITESAVKADLRTPKYRMRTFAVKTRYNRKKINKKNIEAICKLLKKAVSK